MKKSILKFRNIKFPIFTLKKKPYSITYSASKIYCTLHPGDHKRTVDDKTLSGDYFARLMQLEHRLDFDYTCKNLQDLIFTNSKWGIDAEAIPHDFSKLEAVPVEKRLVVKTNKTLIWIKHVSYPFELLTNEKLEFKDDIYATVVYVNGEWFLKEFSYDKTLSRPYVYV
jgi:hypothetical protein